MNQYFFFLFFFLQVKIKKNINTEAQTNTPKIKNSQNWPKIIFFGEVSATDPLQVVPFALVCSSTIPCIISPKLQNNDRNFFFSFLVRQ